MGLVSVRDAAIYGRDRTLVPYASGRCIKSVRFIPSNAQIPTGKLFFVTPNTAQNSGLAKTEQGDLDHAVDTPGLLVDSIQTTIGGLTGSPNEVGWTQIIDVSPLIALVAGGSQPIDTTPIGTWDANTRYCLGDQILDGNDNIQIVSTNGVSGSSEPTWATIIDDTTDDGTITWTVSGPCPSGAIHAIAEVIEGVNPMPPYPASIEFIDPPSNVVAGEIMSPVTVILKDQNGDPYIFQQHGINLGIFGVGTLGGTVNQSIDATTAIATFDDLTIAEAANGYVIRARTYPFTTSDMIFSPSFNVT